MKTLTLPKGSPDPLPELAPFLAPFAPLFRRSTSRRSLERYVTGLLTDLPRKNCETIAQAVAATSLEQLQHLLTDAAWDPLALDEQRVRLLVERSPAHGVLVLDDTGLPKQGKASVGVQAQYSGTLGKQGNCQIVVSAEYVVDDPATPQPLHWPVTARLYLPQSWVQDRARCRQAHVPDAVDFASKPELAVQLLDQAWSWGVSFATVGTDAGYGIPSFLRALDERGMAYVCAVAYDFGVRLPAEIAQTTAEPVEPSVRRRGQPKKPRPAPRHTAQALTADQPEDAWQIVESREGSQGILRKQVVALRVHAGTGCARHSETHGRSWTGPEGWLLGERPLPGEDGEPRWFFSSLSADTPLARLGELAHLRWPIEQFYEDAKGECGLDHFQGRTWEGVHRHVALVMLAYTFLMLQSLEDTPSATPASGTAFPPSATPQSSRLPPAGPHTTLPGSRLMVDRNQASQSVPSAAKLTE
ncbi:MAG TPA: IS701 family transposase [Ktedonobacterales bacterium]|nr:IS701 family transposase [Ktedonobacterales bacterium]